MWLVFVKKLDGRCVSAIFLTLLCRPTHDSSSESTFTVEYTYLLNTNSLGATLVCECQDGIDTLISEHKDK